MSEAHQGVDREIERLRRRVAALQWTLVGLVIAAGTIVGLGAAQQEPARVVGFAVVHSQSGSNVVMYRAWSHGGVDRRLIPAGSDLTFQGGWRVVPEKYN